jgi:hypothetical protein
MKVYRTSSYYDDDDDEDINPNSCCNRNRKVCDFVAQSATIGLLLVTYAFALRIVFYK